ncbi:nucleoside triphosphate pyrophosphohydrolase [Bacillus phage BCASJ1c]|uniref:23 n=1 Tax=Bacillus phage BCASJ1c TaxID=294382 RepID=Q5YA87_9CAUD|nr:nucleoside triphosphate pyrophosphohydrolase [Bacillus phage BCASJ1c]AAU85070.1 23 [Bacillus phage BCASJ1c]
MDFNELFLKQAVLDKHIMDEHNLVGQDLIKKKCVALICELYECVNEARFFKFWSKQKPRQKVTQVCGLCDGTGDEAYQANLESRLEGGPGHPYEKCDDCNGTGVLRVYNPILEEYVDSVHFALSIGNDLDYTKHEYKDPGQLDLSNSVLGLTQLITVLPYAQKKNMGLIFDYLIQLGYQFGFDEDMVKQAYYEKNKENFRRQEAGY